MQSCGGGIGAPTHRAEVACSGAPGAPWVLRAVSAVGCLEPRSATNKLSK
jgi:hypothetical protein